jgi:hypothetical protein
VAMDSSSDFTMAIAYCLAYDRWGQALDLGTVRRLRGGEEPRTDEERLLMPGVAAAASIAMLFMRYYKVVGAPPSQQPTASSTPPVEPSAHTPQRVPKGLPVSRQAADTRMRELVTLVEDAKRGKAQVRTGEGEIIVCTGFLPLPVDRQGMRCRADVTRQGGKAHRAIFKRWD